MRASNASTLRPLILMQKKILRAMSYKPRCEPSAPLLRSFNFLNIYNINLYMCGLFTFKRLIAESEWFTTYRPYEYNTRLSNMSTLNYSSKPYDFSFQTIRSVGGGLSMEWTTGGAPRCFTELQLFQETTQKGLNETGLGSGAPLVVSSEAARTTKYYESGGHD